KGAGFDHHENPRRSRHGGLFERHPTLILPSCAVASSTRWSLPRQKCRGFSDALVTTLVSGSVSRTLARCWTAFWGSASFASLQSVCASVTRFHALPEKSGVRYF